MCPKLPFISFTRALSHLPGDTAAYVEDHWPTLSQHRANVSCSELHHVHGVFDVILLHGGSTLRLQDGVFLIQHDVFPTKVATIQSPAGGGGRWAWLFSADKLFISTRLRMSYLITCWYRTVLEIVIEWWTPNIKWQKHLTSDYWTIIIDLFISITQVFKWSGNR